MGFSELLQTYGQNYAIALMTTWSMTAVAYLLVMVFATMLTIMRVSPFKPLRILGDLYVQIFRNIPGVSLIIFIVYALPFLQIILDYKVSVILTAVIVGSAFGSENFMSGINTINIGEIEAARSLGMRFSSQLRYIVIPQALRASILPMTNLLIAIMLTTALGSQVPMNPQELTGLVSYINTRSVGGIATFAISAFCYVGTAVLISFIGNRLDKRVRIRR